VFVWLAAQVMKKLFFGVLRAAEVEVSFRCMFPRIRAEVGESAIRSCIPFFLFVCFFYTGMATSAMP